MKCLARRRDRGGEAVEEMEIKPARAAFEAGALPAGAKVEIVVQAIAKNCC